MSTSSTLIWVQSLTVGNVVWPRTETSVVQSLSLSQGQSPSLETLEEPKPVRAFLSPLDHWRLGRHGNSGTLDLPPSASTLWARCLFSETISSWTYLHQLCNSFKSWFPFAWRETNATYRSSCLMLSICRRSSKFPSLWQVHSLIDSSSHESDEASLLNTTTREQVVASCTYANP